MATRTSELAALLGYASERLGSSWSVVGGNRLKGQVGPEAEGIILFLAAGLEIFTVSVQVGPRFPEVERIVSKAGRAAGLPEAHFRTASQFPTLFERISQLSNLRDYVSIHEHEAVAAALMEKAVPFTLRCGQERIRLLGIDAAELPGHCVEGRRCAPGDPVASKAALADASRGSATIERQGRDVHGRTLARIRVNGIDLSCSQIASGHAIYRPDWDPLARVGTGCALFKPGQSRSAAAVDRRPAQHAPARPSANRSYRNCAEARRAHAAPLRRGAPGYGPHMDREGDGVACEPTRR